MPTETLERQTLSPQELEANLDLWQQRVDQLVQEAPGLADTGEMPEWWFEGGSEEWAVRDSLKNSESANPEGVAKYLDLYSKTQDAMSKIRSNWGDRRHPIVQVGYNLGPNAMVGALKSEAEDGPVHQAYLEFLTQESIKNSVSNKEELEVLRQFYGVETETELLGIGGDEFGDNLRAALITQPMLSAIAHHESVYVSDASYEEKVKSGSDWMKKAVSIACGISQEDAAEYTFSASRNMNGYNEYAADIIKKIDHFGIDRLHNITRTTGIAGLEGYTIDQLERMEKFVNDPEGVAEQLKNHDVSVVMVNRSGDHNGVMRNVANTFDDESDRVLFFEINRIGDIYRRMSTLHKVGIRPSTLVLSAHSSKGQFSISDERSEDKVRIDRAVIAGRQLVKLANENPEVPGEVGYAMHGMKGVSRLVEEYMQSSRAIDDADSDKGRKKIIFQACHAGTRTSQGDVDESGERRITGTESVVSQLGKDLINSGITSGVDIYGAATAIQMHRSELGVYYSALNTDTYERDQFNATRVRISEGRFRQHRVKEIKLRKELA